MALTTGPWELRELPRPARGTAASGGARGHEPGLCDDDLRPKLQPAPKAVLLPCKGRGHGRAAPALHAALLIGS